MMDDEPKRRSDAIARLQSGIRHPLASILLAAAVMGAALFVLHRFAEGVQWIDVKAAMAGLAPERLAAAFWFTAISFVSLSLFDLLALETVAPRKISRLQVAATGAAGFAISNLVGFSWLTGGALRLRVYTALGLDFETVTKVVAIAWLSFWLGLPLVTGIALLSNPSPTGISVGFGATMQNIAGLGLLAGLAFFFWWLSGSERRLTYRGTSLPLPRPAIALAQMAASAVDIVACALILFVLLPADLSGDPAYFLVLYISAIGLGILSHSPGGLGVFEATIVAGLGATGRPDVLASLVLYRIVYHIIPFFICSTCLAVVYGASRSRRIATLGGAAYRVAEFLVPPLAGALAFVMGAVLVLSGNLPSESGRLGILRGKLPLELVEFSHLAGSVAGVLLLVVARGLFRRQRNAWTVTIALLATGIISSLAKGLDWEEALVLATALVAMIVFKPAFFRGSIQPVVRLNIQFALSVGLLLAILTWIGFFAHSHVGYRGDLWWEFAWHGDAPRFLRASLAIAVVLAVLIANSLVSGTFSLLPPEPVPDQVRKLVAASRSVAAHIALTGDKRFLLSEMQDAFIPYADTGNTLVAIGDPVGDSASGQRLIWAMRELANGLGRRCAFYGISAQNLTEYLDMGLTILKIGEVAKVDLRTFGLEGGRKRDFRYARRRMEKDGYVFAIIEAREIPALLPELRQVSDAWLEMKHGEEKGFAVGAFDEDYLKNMDHAVIRDAADRRIVAFANLWKGADRQELSLDLMRHDPDTPGYVMDALFAEVMLWGKAQGYQWFSLGAAPLAGIEQHPLASWWNRFARYVYKHGSHFYHFEGLREFKEKFEPVWQPNYLVVPGGVNAPRILYEINVLISGGISGLLK